MSYYNLQGDSMYLEALNGIPLNNGLIVPDPGVDLLSIITYHQSFMLHVIPT